MGLFTQHERPTSHYKATPHGAGNEVHVIARAAVGWSPHYEPSVCAPYTADLRADFDFTTGSPKEAVCVVLKPAAL